MGHRASPVRGVTIYVRAFRGTETRSRRLQMPPAQHHHLGGVGVSAVPADSWHARSLVQPRRPYLENSLPGPRLRCGGPGSTAPVLKRCGVFQHSAAPARICCCAGWRPHHLPMVDFITMELSGISLPSVIKVFAPIRQFLPIFAPFRTTALMPMSEPSPIWQPCASLCDQWWRWAQW